MQSIKKNKILISIFLIVFFVFIYYFFFSGSGSQNAAVSPGASNGAEKTVGQDILDMLAKMDSIKIDDAVFQSPAWTTLKNFSIAMPTTLPGREDLFGPLGKGGPAVTVPSSATSSKSR